MASTTITEVLSFWKTGDKPTAGQCIKTFDTLRGKFNPLTNYLAADEQAVLWTDNNWYLVVDDTAAGETPATDPDKFYPISKSIYTADITQGGGTANFTVTLPGGATTFSQNVLYIFNVGTVVDATGAVTINPGSGAITVRRADAATNAATQDFESDKYYPMVFNGTVFVLVHDTNVSGTWTPTLTNTANISSSVLVSASYQRVGSTVFVSGAVTITCTASANTATTLGMSLPIASNFSATTQASGVGVANVLGAAAAGSGGIIQSNSTTDVIELRFLSGTTSANTWHFTGSYQII